GRSFPSDMKRSRVMAATSGDFQNGEKRYLKTCSWTFLSAKATPRYGVLFFSATDAAAACRSEPKPPRYATTPWLARVSRRATVLGASDSSSRMASSMGLFVPPTAAHPCAL